MAGPYSYSVLTASKGTIGSILYWINHSAADPTQILAEAQQYIYQKLRAREMAVSTTITAAANDLNIPLPDGFQDPIYLRIDGMAGDGGTYDDRGDGLEYAAEHLLGRIYNPDGTIDTGTPVRWTIFDEAIQFDVPIDASILPYTGRLVYYGTPAPLSVSNETNFLTDRYPTLLRRACLVFGYEARNRVDLMQAEMALVDQALDDANRSADQSRRGQSLRR